MTMGTLLNSTSTNHQFVALSRNFKRIEERLHYLKLRHDLFSSQYCDERLFSSLPARLEKIRQMLNLGKTERNTGNDNLEELSTMLKDLESDLSLRELLQAQRSLINYLSRQEEVYASLSRRWQQLTNTMIGIDALVLNDPNLAARKREELEKGVKELEQCLQSTTPEATRRGVQAPRRIATLAQAS